MTTPESSEYEPNEADAALLREVASENVTWNQPGRRARSFRLWHDDESYGLVTPIAGRLFAYGYIECPMAAGYTFVTRGPVTLTAKGLRYFTSIAKEGE